MQDNKNDWYVCHPLFTGEFMEEYSTTCQKVSYAARIEKLAEESAELAAAASKLARIVRDEYPSKMSENDARNAMMEEVVDVVAAIHSLAIMPDLPNIYTTDTNDQLFMQEHAYHQMLKFIRRMEALDHLKDNPMRDAIAEDLCDD